ncbi:hypothetical protein [Caenimonas koreensis]|uniref:hypothetical protein n=1 Tax=Caenimonas koreensis TaxID=367474 RepID=UPI00188DE8FC|nr:hypothetical protein [Caenimonas koreensis]
MLQLLFRAAACLVLPLAVLLCAQWPLRDAIQAFSREANDLAQILFAVYMAVAVTAASQSDAHLAAAHSPASARAPWRRWAIAACVVPWALFVLWTSGPQVWRSVAQLEHFGETLNPGFFIIKLSLAVMLGLVVAHAIAPTKPATVHS